MAKSIIIERKESKSIADFKIAFGKIVETKRKGLKLSQRDLGMVIGVSESNICQVESGSHVGGFETLGKLAHILDFSIDALMIAAYKETYENCKARMLETLKWKEEDKIRKLIKQVGKDNLIRIQNADLTKFK